MHLGVYALFFGLQTLIRPSVTWNRNRLSSSQWILRQVLKFKPRRVKHHAKRNRWCRYDNFGRLVTLPDFSLTDFKRFLAVLTDRHLFGNHYLFRTGMDGCELHPSDQAIQCPVFTLLRYMWSSCPWQVFHGVGSGVFSHKPTDYCIMIAHLTSNSFAGNSCWLHADYFLSLRLRYSPS